MSGTCSRCGRAGEMEYGTDGLSYCSSCAFYGMNKQCSRCRMYVPATELQQYGGQWACPYCIMNLRDADRKTTERARESPPQEALSYSETCERCGRDLKDHVYIWNGKRLCRKCLEYEQEQWELVSGKPSGAGQRVSVVAMRAAKKKSLLESAISDILAFLGFRRKAPQEIVVYGDGMPISHAKPMAEKAMAAKHEQARPQSEGLMAMRRKRGKNEKKKEQPDGPEKKKQ